MNPTVQRSLAARRDLVAIYHRLASQASLKTADRFVAVAESTFVRLASRPGIGPKLELEGQTGVDLRYSPLPTRFKKYVVIYRPSENGIDVVRVLHGAQDISGILADEAEEPETDDPPP